MSNQFSSSLRPPLGVKMCYLMLVRTDKGSQGNYPFFVTSTSDLIRQLENFFESDLGRKCLIVKLERVESTLGQSGPSLAEVLEQESLPQ